MAKKTTAKKSKRRLKRTVRRSMAAVLMITAVVVAAIPVPENAAADPTSRAGVGRAVIDKHDMEEFSYDESLDSADEVVPPTGINLNRHENQLNDPSQWEGLVADGTLHTSYALTPLDEAGNSLMLSWQFMYYYEKHPVSHLDSGVICKYNNSFPVREGTVELRMQPIEEYYTVASSLYTNYYDGGMTEAEKKQMDNDPTEEIIFNYTVYSGTEAADNAIKDFLAEYCANEQGYKDILARFEQYDKDLAAYNGASAEDKVNMTKPEVPKERYTVRPSDVVTGEKRLRYFCQHHKRIKTFGPGEWKLRGVVDGTLGGDGGTIYLVCVPENIDPANINPDYTKDDAGYLVSKKSQRVMCAIGNKAFQGVQNVTSMDIPTQIGYIGDDAFADATLLETITIGNTAHIGNRAFKGCSKLKSVKIAQGTQTIGNECFRDTAIEEIELPITVTKIGFGAFAYCRSLTSVNLNNIAQNNRCEIGEYAFYDARELKKIEMQNAGITSIGDAAFAVESGSQELGIVLPSLMANLSDKNSIGNYLFANRSALKYVVFPQDYGTTNGKYAKLPKEMFHGCANLEYVEFPCSNPRDVARACGYVSFDPGVDYSSGEAQSTYDGLFQDIVNPDFYVRGPELNMQNEEAYPRTSTWDAVTTVSSTVPYMYVKDGVEYYEVSDGKYLLCIQKENSASKEGILSSCKFKPGIPASQKKNVALEIPAIVGDTKVTGIGEKCFEDSELNENVISLRISDGSISAIDNRVFKGGGGVNNKDWLQLRKVYIGNSVTSIGEEAFAGCNKLADVTFGSPGDDHSGFSFGKDAFKTGGSELTFHGDIASDYQPFIWAMDPANVIDKDRVDDEGNNISEGIRVCYRGLAPTYTTVMYNPITEMVTMLDYPKQDQIKSTLAEAHGLDMEDENSYNKYRENILYNQYKDTDYDGLRTDFANAWKNANGDETLYSSELYGPWINNEFCLAWESWLDISPSEPDGGDGDENGGDEGASAIDVLSDLLFKPLTVEAAEENPGDTATALEPYYSIYPYDVLAEKENRDRYHPSTKEEDYLLNAVKNIEVPEGVKSIDVFGFVKDLTVDGKEYSGEEQKSNWGNYQKYFTGRNSKWDKNTTDMYLEAVAPDENDKNKARAVPGLFSGYYRESEGENQRGNDTIRSVTMKSVEYLPDYAFDSCENLQSVTLGDACMNIGRTPFRGCYALREMVGNSKYQEENGIIYSKDTDDSYIVEECFASRGKAGMNKEWDSRILLKNDPKLSDVKTIRPGAFEDCDVITEVYFGRDEMPGLKEIPENCFKNCDALERITLPMSVNDIGRGAFAQSNRLSGLTIYGREVKISGAAFEKDSSKVTTTVEAYADSAVVRYVKEYGADYKLEMTTREDFGEQWKVTFVDPNYNTITNLVDRNGNPLDNPMYVGDGESIMKIPAGPVIDGWTFQKWVGTNGVNLEDGAITADTVFIAEGHYEGGAPVNGKYAVEFFDGVDGSPMRGFGASDDGKYYVDAGKSFADMGFEAPAHKAQAGYEPMGYRDYRGEWTVNTVTDRNLSVILLYSAASTSGGSTSGGSTSGGTTSSGTTSGGSTNNTSKNSGSNSSSKNSSSSSSSSTSSSSTSTTSTTTSGAGQYTVFVDGGSGSGSYAPGTTVIISCYTPAEGMRFSNWTTDSNGVTLASASMTVTTFTMPSNNVTVKANYVEAPAAPAVAVNTGGGGGTGNTTGNTGDTTGGNGNTRVDIEKPGISNRDLATANTNGSTDNFIVKISETDEATRAVAAALTNKYGTLDNILYYAMDISLYDSTGTTKITDTTGLSVDITIPIPDSLVAYGGNNMAGAVINGDQLESLNENFTTINGVPCIRFRAEHFSPYTIYVDTGNLVEGMLDVTPKTGDPIHPKWFLSLGLACLSVILFMKRDRKVAVKAK